MKKIFELLQQRKKEGDVGIEIEVEGASLKVADDVTRYWCSHDDGSLRGAFPGSRHEYVCKVPVKIGEVKAALEELNVLNKDAKPFFSFRTSVHMHINVQDLTEDELYAMIYTYILLEEPLMSYCGRERKCNRFCLRIQDAEFTLNVINDMFRNGVKSDLLRNEMQIRYSALNLAALPKYGSVEFRGMRGTMDVAILSHWASTLVSIREFARGKALTDVYNMFCKMEPSDFIRQVIPEHLVTLFTYKNYQSDMRLGFSLSLELPFSYAAAKRQRETAKAVLEKPILKEKKVNMGIDAADLAVVPNQNIVWDLGLAGHPGRLAEPLRPRRLNHIPPQGE